MHFLTRMLQNIQLKYGFTGVTFVRVRDGPIPALVSATVTSLRSARTTNNDVNEMFSTISLYHIRTHYGEGSVQRPPLGLGCFHM